ncbi:MAG: lytic murein transglycosylase B [Lamprobacter sp.]|uniref:lytic murein transglycosylase B n=1 Tax=Lamprobacter sp. TaxID=3100796 RepID=UPI002B2644F0|nr:lytic murein transglycosylase B [Lamprobacter sp.]MEA3641698.1 lytic murein transglycosylase B [Lamprobacter sp.]
MHDMTRILTPIALLSLAVVLSACSSQPAKQPERSARATAGSTTAALKSSPPSTSAFASMQAAAVSSDARYDSNAHFRAVSSAGLQGSRQVTGGDFAGRADVERFIDRMQGKGLDRAELVRIFERTQRDPTIIGYMDKQWRPASGPTGAWTRYRSRHITPAMLDKGSAFWARHAKTLDQASKKYGVPPEYIVAIIGVETRWGGYMGTHRIIDALATLAFDYPRRAEYFQEELAQFLLMAEDQGFDPLQPVGSFAGAMGLGQFMPSSWRDYAVDFDGDGRRDLWNPEDAIGSVAHYFHAHGWEPGAAVVARTSGGAGLPWSTDTGFKTNYSVASLKAKGIQPAVALPDQRQVSLLRLDAAGGLEYWLGFENFYVITRYNNSTYYAMTVHQLAQALRSRRGLNQPTLRMTDQPGSGAFAVPAG